MSCSGRHTGILTAVSAGRGMDPREEGNEVLDDWSCGRDGLAEGM